MKMMNLNLYPTNWTFSEWVIESAAVSAILNCMNLSCSLTMLAIISNQDFPTNSTVKMTTMMMIDCATDDVAVVAIVHDEHYSEMIESMPTETLCYCYGC